MTSTVPIPAPAAESLELLRTMLGTAVPFAGHAGVELVEVGDGVAAALLPEAPTTLNHVGSQHAGALFTCAEAASGGAMAGALAEKILEVRPLVKTAEIRYRKVAHGTIRADAATATSGDEIRAGLAATGKVEVVVDVVLTDESGVEVATVRVDWVVVDPAARDRA